MKLEYKLKESGHIMTSTIEVNERPEISISVDGSVIFSVCGLDIESINITELLK